MRRKLTILLAVWLCYHTAHSQCFPADFCAQVDESCFCQNNIDGFSATITDQNTDIFPGNSLCPNGGSPHNNSWQGFAAGTTQISIQIDISNCTSEPCGGGTCTGLQAGIYSACPNDGGTSIVCEGTCDDTQITLSSGNFQIGGFYYLFVDGCAGSVCDYQFTVLQGSTNPPPPGPMAGPLNGPAAVCENEIAGPFGIAPVAFAGIYEWTLPPGATIVNGGSNEATIQFGTVGGQVCVRATSQCYPSANPTPICTNVTIVPPATSDLAETYCTGSSFFYEGDGNNYIDLGFPYPIVLQGASWRGCDSTVNLTVTAVPNPPNPVTDFVCEGDIYTFSGNGQTYFPGFNEIVLSNAGFGGCDSTVHLDLIQNFDAVHSIDVAICQGDFYQACGTNLSLTSFYTLESDLCGNSFQGCDSTVFVNLTVLDPQSVISVDPPGVIGCDGAGIVLHGFGSNPLSETYEWTSPDLTADICSGNPFDPAIVVCAAATYCLTTTMSYTDFLGNTTTCSDMFCVDVTEDLIAPDISASATNVNCSGDGNGTAEVTVTNLGAGPFSYFWSPGDFTTASISGLTAGNYTVTVTGNNGCATTETVMVSEPAAITGMIDAQAINCNGAANGTATVMAAGGSGTYTYLWCNGQTTATATDLPPGMCSVTITDNNMCSTVESTDITQPTVISANASHQNITCNGADDGTADVVASGGDDSFTYLWCNGQTTSNATSLPPGMCTVTVTDGNGCVMTTSVTITEPTAVTAMLDATNVSCNGGSDGTATVSPAGGDGTYSYLWCNSQTTATATGLSVGACAVTVTDGNNCTTVESIMIDENAALSLDASGTPVSCNGGSDGTATVTASGGDDNFTYIWCDGQTGSTATGLSVGICAVTVTDGNGCSEVTNVDVTEPLAVQASADFTAVSCNGGSDGTATVTASGGDDNFTYVWCDGQTGDMATGLSVGICAVTVTDGNGCSEVTSVDVTEPLAVQASADFTAVSCNGGSDGTATVTASGGDDSFTYVWCDGQTGDMATGLSVGICAVTVTDGNGCSEVTSVDVTEPVALDIQTDSENVSCFGSSDGTGTITASGGSGNFTYVWCDGQTGSTATGLSVGICAVTVTDGNGCFEIASVDVAEPLAVQASADFTAISCNGGSDGTATVSASGGDDSFTYVWCDGQTGSTATGLSVGICAVTVTDGNGCADVASVDVTEPLAVQASADFIEVSCNGGSDGTATAMAIGGSGNFSYVWCNGQTGDMATGLSVGICAVTVTDDNGCFDIIDVELTEPTPLNLFTTSDNVSCFGASDGEANVSVTGGAGNYTYIWCNGQTSDSATDLPAGDCSVTVTDQNGCIQTTMVSLTEPAALSLSMDGTNVTCNGANDGTATVNVDGGAGGFTYQWCNGQTNPTATSLPAGMCQVTVTDGNGCFEIMDIEITQPAVLAVTATTINVSCNGGTDGSAMLDVSGGTGDYTYQWCNGNSDASINGLSAGSCMVEVSDENGCSEILEIMLTEPALLEVAMSQTDVSCNGGSNGEAMAAPTGGNGNYTYLWCDGQTTAMATGLSAGQCEVTITDDQGCIEIGSILLTEPVALSLSANGTNLSCNDSADGTATVAPSGGTGDYSYAWCDGQTTATASGLPAGTCSVTVTDENGCQEIVSVDLTEPMPIQLTTSTVDASCTDAANGSATVVATGGSGDYTYVWNDNNGQFTPTANSLGSGDFEVTVTDANGCQEITSVIINEPLAALSATGSSTPATCGTSNGSIALDVNGGTGDYSFEWNLSELNNQQNPSDLGPGLYSVTITDENGCEATIDVNVDTPSGLAVTPATTMVSCNGGNNGSVTLDIVGGSGPYEILWDINGFDDMTTLIDVPVGVYNATITDADDCEITASATVEEPQALDLVVSASQASCGGSDGMINLNVTGGSGTYTFDWDNAPDVEDPTGLSAGIYNVTVTDGNDCMITANTEITVPNAPVLDFVNQEVSCNGGADGSIVLSIDGGQEPYQFLWNQPGLDGVSDPAGLSAGQYIVTVIDFNNCEAVTSIDITEPTVLTINEQSTAVSCNGGIDGEASVNVDGGTGNYTYQWCDGQTTATATGLAAGTCSVTITDENNCTEIRVIDIQEPMPLNSQLSTIDANCNGQNSGVIDLQISGGTGAYTFQWSQVGLDPSAVGAGTYAVTISDENGCETTISSIQIDEPSALSVDGMTDPATCGSSNGSISLSVIGGNPPYTYDWTDPMIGNTGAPTSLAPGIYDVMIFDNNGCSIASTWNVETPSGLAVDQIQGSNATCNGGSDGSIALDIQGGNPPYTFNWNDDNLDGFEDPTGLAAGDYLVTITDGDGCTLTASSTITEPSLVVATGTATDATCGSNNGSIALTINGGAGNYTFDWDAAMDVQNPNGLAPGTYNVTVTDGSGCTGTASVTVETPSGLAATAASDAVSCNGGADGIVNLDVVGGNPPYTIDWSDDQYDGLQNLTGVASGNLSVTITDADGCSIINSVDVEQPQLLMASGIITDASCSNDDGAINIVVEGGTGTLDYTWSAGGIGNVQDPNGLSAGDYTLTVTDANGCTAVTTATITIPDAPDASISGVGVQCFNGTDGSINLAINGGTAPYNFAWSDAGIGDVQNPSGLAAGTYEVTISDVNACTTVEAVTITEPDAIVLSAVPTDALCGDANGSITLDVNGGTGSYTFDWDNNANDIQNPAGLTPGLYTVIVSDSNGCTSTTSAEVSTPTGLGITATSVDANCFGATDGAIVLNVVGGTPGYSFAWSDGSIGDVQNPTDLGAGNYIVTITDVDGCTVTAEATIDEPSPVTASGVSTDAQCGEANGTIDLTVMGGSGTYDYLWDNGAGVIEDPANLFAGTYNVTITDANNCTTTTSVTVTTPNQLAVDFQATNVSCFGDTDGSIDVLTTGGIPPFDYDWSDDSLDGIEDPSNLASGIYTVTVIDAEDCEFFTTINIQEPTALTAIADDANTSCNGGSDGTITIASGGGTGAYDYLWSVGGVGNNSTANGLAVGTYTVTVTDENGCTATTTAIVGEPLALEAISEGQSASCFGAADGSINLTITGGTAPYNFDWNVDALDGIEDPVNVQAGLYTVIISDANACTMVETVSVVQPDALSIDATDISSYSGFNLSCADATDGYVEVLGSGGVGPYAYAWNTGATTSRIEDLSPGTYEVIITDASGCTTPFGINLTSPAPINLQSSSLAPDCLGDNDGVVFIDTVTGGTAPFLYSLDDGVFGTVEQFVRLTAGEYQINIEDANGCEFAESIVVNDGFDLRVSLGNDLDYQLTNDPLDSMLIQATANVPFAVLDTFFWGALPNCLDDCTQQLILPTETTIYSFTVIDENGCISTDEMRVNVRKDRLVYIPNAFSPDGNDANERFMIYGGNGVAEVQDFRVFNRWGEVVHSANNFLPDDPSYGWDGRFRGNILNPGVFVYYAKVLFADGHVEEYQGDVTLMR